MGSLPHRQLRNDEIIAMAEQFAFTAAQAAQKLAGAVVKDNPRFTAAQAAQKNNHPGAVHVCQFTAAQAAQK